MKQFTLRIIPLGLNKQMRNVLEMYFEFNHSNEYEIVSENGDLLIIDVDNYETKSTVETFRKENPAIPAIIFSIKDIALEYSKDIFLKKPLNQNELKKALLSIEPDKESSNQQLELKNNNKSEKQKNVKNNNESAHLYSVPNPEKINKKVTEIAVNDSLNANNHLADNNNKYVEKSVEAVNINDLSYQPEVYLQGHLYRLSRTCFIHNKSRILQLKIDGASFIIKQDGLYIKTLISNSKLKSMSAVAFSRDHIEINELSKDWSEIKGKEYHIDEMLWMTALWASKGRVPSGTDFKSMVLLRYWPNLPRLEASPHASKIAALWKQQPMSLVETSTYLNIPKQDVFSFFSATQALGISYNVDFLVADKKTVFEKHKNHKVFSNIIEHINRKDIARHHQL